MAGDKIRDSGEEFDLRGGRFSDFYPADDVLVEIGRVAIAAARVDNQFALVLSAVKYPEPENPESLERLRKWPTSRLAAEARKVLKRRFEGDLLDAALAIVDCAAERQEKRHACLHSLWMPEPRDTLFKVGILRDWSLRRTWTSWCGSAEDRRNTRRFTPAVAVLALRR